MNLQMPSRTTFAASVMVLIGGLQLLTGLATVRDPDAVYTGGDAIRVIDSHLLSLDPLGWGWIYLIAGAFVVAVGVVLAMNTQRDPWPAVGVCAVVLSGLIAFWVPLDLMSSYQTTLAYIVILWGLTTDARREVGADEDGQSVDDGATS